MENALNPQELDVVLSVMEELDTAVSLSVAIKLRYNDMAGVTSQEVLPHRYLTAEPYLRDAAAASIFKKWKHAIAGMDPSSATTIKWLESERSCMKTNLRIYPIIDGLSEYDGRILSFLKRVRKEVYYLIGELHELPDGRFGPGATVSDSSQRCLIPDKLSSCVTLTRGSFKYLTKFRENLWGRFVISRQEDLREVRGNHYFEVPKRASINRPCAKEPSFNAFYQRGLGLEIKKRLKRRGYDLERLPDLHRELARRASLDDSLATIDLSSASDTLARSVVELLLPRGWFEALNALRSPYTFKDGRWYKLEKFSSMGNGFTFELETVIFLAIARIASSSNDVSVFGDDIIVPASGAIDTIAALKFLGFSTNVEKTFTSGSFRESCGGDFFEGKSVRPHFLEEFPREPQDIISFANGFRRVRTQLAACNPSNPIASRAWFRILDLLPRDIRCCRGPEGLGDIVIHDTEEHWKTRWRDCIRSIRCYRPAEFRRVGLNRYCNESVFATVIYLAGFGEESSPYSWIKGVPYLTRRNGVVGHKVAWVAYS